MIRMKGKRNYTGLNEALAKMPKWDAHNGYYVEIHYDLDEDTVLYNPHVAWGEGSWTVDHDPKIIRVGTYHRRPSKKAIIADIEAAIAFHKAKI